MVETVLAALLTQLALLLVDAVARWVHAQVVAAA